MIQSKFFKKCLAVFLAFFLVFSSAPGWHNFSFAVSGTINFSGVDMSETGDTVTDGQTGSVAASDIPGIDIDIFGSTDKTTKVGKFIYLDFQNVITPSDVPTYTYNYIVIQSRDGSNFNLQSIYINNCNMMEDAVFVEGVRDGVTQGTVNLVLDPGGNPSQFTSSNGLDASIFQNVDKVLISSNTVSSTDITAGIGGIQIGDAVQPTVTLTADTTNNSVDNELEITFPPDATFESSVTGITYDGNALTSNQYTVSSGKVTLKPSVSENVFLRTPKTGNVVVTATGYGNSTVSQTLLAGAVASIEVNTQPVPGASSGLTFSTQPVVNLKDQYNNLCSNGVSSTANVIASTKSGTGSWIIGGTTTKAAVGGIATFTDLSHTLVSAGNGSITFTSGLITTESQTFNIPQNASKTLTADTSNDDVDHDLEITFASDATFEGAITGITYDGNALTNNQYTISSGKVTLKPSVADNAFLRTPKIADVVIQATDYEDSVVSQTIQAGLATTLEIVTQPVAGASSGANFATQPIVQLKDQYGNVCTTGSSATASVVAGAKNGTGTWTIGGTTTKAAVSGVVSFSDLSHTLLSAGNGSITFTSGALTMDSQSFTIPEKAAKTLTADTTANDVDSDLEITFVSDAAFESAITGVSFDGNPLTSNQYVVSSGKVTLMPSVADNAYLRTSKTANVVVSATSYGDSIIAQTILPGAMTTLEVFTQPVAGASNGLAFATQPVVRVLDQYGNLCSLGTSASVNVTASAKNGTGSWTIGGTTTKSAVSGVVTFTDLTHTLVSTGNGSITFTSGAKTVDTQSFNVPQYAAKTLTADTTNNTVDYDIEITFAPDLSFENAITGVSYGGHTLSNNQFVVGSGKVTLKPIIADNAYLRTAGTENVVIHANTYGDSIIPQTIGVGALHHMILTQNVTPPTAMGGDFAQQPVVALVDQYENVVTTDETTVVTVAKEDLGDWTLKGNDTVTASAGLVTFSGLGITNTKPVSNAQLRFTATGLSKVLSNTMNLPGPPTSPSTEPSTEPADASLEATSTTDEKVVVIVNGVAQNTGMVSKSVENGLAVLTVEVDAKSIERQIDEAINKGTPSTTNKIQIPIMDTSSDRIKVALTGDVVKQLEKSTFDVSVKRDNVEYVIPASEFTITKVGEALGKGESALSEIEIIVKLDKVDQTTRARLQDGVKAKGAEVVFDPIAFDISAQGVDANGQKQTVEIKQFTTYVERILTIDGDIDPSKITTGIVFNEDGTFNHVPTEVYNENGKWYARVNSKTNSKYAVIWHPIEVDSVAQHWSKTAVNDMASRLVVTDYEVFKPNQVITRSEFTDYLVRALGLYRSGISNTSPFSDVPLEHEYLASIAYAKSFGLVTGTADGFFNPEGIMTREEAMVLLARAMKFAQYVSSGSVEDAMFDDFGQVSSWAEQSVTEVLSAKLIVGIANQRLAPQKTLTKAESVQMIQTFLVKTGLIN